MNGATSRTVVVTGASAGVGRAVARRIAANGATVGLIARGQAGLDGAARDVERLGGRAVILRCDIADNAAADAAADQIERDVGPIDVWVNKAMALVFSPVREMKADEYRRVTEVTYLGSAHGTMAALRHMRPRDRARQQRDGVSQHSAAIVLLRGRARDRRRSCVNWITNTVRCACRPSTCRR